MEYTSCQAAVDGSYFICRVVECSNAHIKIDPETVRYPQVWTREEALVRDKEIKVDEKVSYKQSHSLQEAISTPQTEPVKREKWEKQMLKLALACLKDNPANAGEEMQTATFRNGKYRVIYHQPSEMLRVVDEENQRGTLYKLRKGEAVQICKFTDEEKLSFEILVVESSQKFVKQTWKDLHKE